MVDSTVKGLQLTAKCEGLFSDPVYTAKTMVGLFHFVQQQKISGNVCFGKSLDNRCYSATETGCLSSGPCSTSER